MIFFILLYAAAYFYHIVEHLVNTHGYVRDKNIHGAPYDFRKAPSKESY